MSDIPLEDLDPPPVGDDHTHVRAAVIPPVVWPFPGGAFAESGELQNLTPIPARPDMVNQPPHYTGGSVECIEAIEVATEGLEGIEAYCTAAALKYLWRWKKKNGAEDLEKARWYINRMLARMPG